jgi:hypothetical protein
MKNKYIQALRSWIRLLQNDKIVYKMLEKTFIADTLPQWEDHVDEAFALARDFESEMSPVVLFKALPLSRCDQDTKQWLGELIHALWMVRYSVNMLIADAGRKAESAKQAYNTLQDALKTCTNTKSIEAIRPLKPLFDEFCRCCEALAGAIEKFPSEIKAI